MADALTLPRTAVGSVPVAVSELRTDSLQRALNTRKASFCRMPSVAEGAAGALLGLAEGTTSFSIDCCKCAGACSAAGSVPVLLAGPAECRSPVKLPPCCDRVTHYSRAVTVSCPFTQHRKRMQNRTLERLQQSTQSHEAAARSMPACLLLRLSNRQLSLLSNMLFTSPLGQSVRSAV